jgi:tRNA dimethylallyltransferase
LIWYCIINLQSKNNIKKMKLNKNKQKILVVLGATATGKSDMAVKIAKEFNGEIISADSRQIYKGLDIGTGKITIQEMQGIHHYMLDIASPRQKFSASKFCNHGEYALNKIIKKGKLPIIAGGTGFYISALLGDIELASLPPNIALRATLSKKGAPELRDMLRALDPLCAERIDTNNPRRLIRAIEIASADNTMPEKNFSGIHTYNPLFIGLWLPDKELRKKINNRLNSRIKHGMIAEIENLHKCGLSWTRLNELGLEYRYISKYLQGELTKKEVIEILQNKIWQYARRQKTWFKRDKRINWYSPDQYYEIKHTILSYLKL